MNLFLLSNTDNLNNELSLILSEEIGKRGSRIAYISSAKQTGERKYYLATMEDFKKINEASAIDYFDLSEDFSDLDLAKLKDYKIIYLSGGNTFTFLKDSKDRGLGKILKELEPQCLLIGASAGSIMMTEKIDICKICDSNTAELKDLSSFNFVPFEFHPHFKEQDLPWLREYKNTTQNKIYLCKDSDGVQYKDGKVITFGEIIRL